MAMKHFKDAQSKNIASLGIDGINASLQDLVSSSNNTSPISCGFFKIEAGNPLPYTYSYDEWKIMLEGEMTISEEDGETIRLKPGDVVYFDSGTKVTFSSNTSGTAFYVGQRAWGQL